MKRCILFLLASFFCPGLLAQNGSSLQIPGRFPADNAKNINPDTHLILTFSCIPILGTSGQIRIYDAADNKLVDMLDLSIPPGPTVRGERAAPSTKPYEYAPGRFTNANTRPGTPSGSALPTSDNYQLTIIGGFTDAFHFYPVIIHDSIAIIYPHNNLLEYHKTYYVQIDPGVFTFRESSFPGISWNTRWTFSTKKSPPKVDSDRLIVSGNGSGDFNTVQGAIDFIPDNHPKRTTIFMKNGLYEEIVYFRNKTNVTLLGEDRDKVIVFYANNEIFNPHPSNIGTNEVAGTFPSRRAAFMGDNSRGMILANFTVKTTAKGQAEGLLLMGEKNIISNVNIDGSGDALQVNGSVYLTDCSMTGDGDIILGRGPAFFNQCILYSNGGTYMWIRNTSANHGNVFLRCKFQTLNNRETEIARSPTNNGKDYPYAEAVLIHCALSGITPAGWGPVGGDVSNIHYWEYKSINVSDGSPVDVSKRSPVSRQLNEERDNEIITSYCTPPYVLGGWTPTMAPIILSQPAATAATAGRITIRVRVIAIPAAAYQWFKNGVAIKGATDAALTLESVQAHKAVYTVSARNESGSVTSRPAAWEVN